MEMIMVQADSGIDDRYIPHQVECITAFDLDGNMLWQNGKPVIEPGKFGSDFPAQVHDIDGDGNLEVLCVMNKNSVSLTAVPVKLKRNLICRMNMHMIVLFRQIFPETAMPGT